MNARRRHEAMQCQHTQAKAKTLYWVLELVGKIGRKQIRRDGESRGQRKVKISMIQSKGGRAVGIQVSTGSTVGPDEQAMGTQRGILYFSGNICLK